MLKVNTDCLYAYLAGIVDGEAYIGIKKDIWGMNNRPDVKSPTYHERISIKMKNPEIPKLFQDTFNGRFYKEPKIYQSKTGFTTKHIMYLYQATDKIAANIISCLIPFLIEKKAQANYILKLRESKNSKEARMRGGKNQKRTMSQTVLDYREQLYQAIKEIHRG